MLSRIPKEDTHRTMMFMRASQPVVDALNDQGVYGAMQLKEIDPRMAYAMNSEAFKELMYQRYRDMMEQYNGI